MRATAESLRGRIWLFVGLALGITLPGPPLWAEYRLWSDAGEKNRVEAEFIELVDGVLSLKRKRDGETIQVRLDQLRSDDQTVAKKAQEKLIMGRADKLPKNVKPRQVAPIIVVAAYRAAHASVGPKTETQASSLAMLAADWAHNGVWLDVAGDLAPKLTPAERVELAFRAADELAGRLGGILTFGQQERLIQLQWSTPMPMITHPPAITWLQVLAIREELELTEQQKSKLTALFEEHWSDYARMTAIVAKTYSSPAAKGAKSPATTLSLEDLPGGPRENQRIHEILTDAQRKRLDQIRLHLDPTTELLLERRLMGKLKLDKRQQGLLFDLHRSLVKKALAAYHAGPGDTAIRAPDDVLRKLVLEARQGVQGILSAQQKSDWEELLGDSFDLWERGSPFTTGAAATTSAAAVTPLQDD